MLARCLIAGAAMVFSAAPAAARAWGYEGHEIIADIARGYLTPTVRAKVAQGVAAVQLQKAGVRLALVLNRALGR